MKNRLLNKLKSWSYPAKTDEDPDEIPLDKIVDLAQELISIRSTTDNKDALKDALKTATKELKRGFTTEHFEADGRPSLLIHNAKPGTKHFKIILNAHLDVVQGKDNQFEPYTNGGKLHGRGSFDMKAAAAVMIYVFKNIARTVPYPLALQLVTDEEIAKGAGTLSQIQAGIRTDMAIMGECGSNMDIINETKGLIHATLSTKGSAAHGAYLWNGQNAIIKMYEAISLIQKQFPVPQTATLESTINVSQIATSNQTWNQVPDNCTATIDIRIHRKDSKTILKKIRDVLPDGVTLHVEQARNAHYTDPKNHYITQLKTITETVLGKEVSIRSTFGGSDTVMFSDVGCDAVEFGPVGKGQHHDGESVEIKSLGEYYQILKTFLLSVK